MSNNKYGIKTKTVKGKMYTAEEVEEFIETAFLEGINNGEDIKKKILEIKNREEEKDESPSERMRRAYNEMIMTMTRRRFGSQLFSDGTPTNRLDDQDDSNVGTDNDPF